MSKPRTYKECKEAGICPACRNRPAENGLVHCVPCKERKKSPEAKAAYNQMVAARGAKRLAAGVCVTGCSNPPLPGKQKCSNCYAQELEARRAVKRTIIDQYGGKCSCCGETTLEFLSIDHAGGGGHQDRLAGFNYKQLLNKPVDPAFRVLCMNCNQSIGIYGYCPHQHGK